MPLLARLRFALLESEPIVGTHKPSDDAVISMPGRPLVIKGQHYTPEKVISTIVSEPFDASQPVNLHKLFPRATVEHFGDERYLTLGEIKYRGARRRDTPNNNKHCLLATVVSEEDETVLWKARPMNPDVACFGAYLYGHKRKTASSMLNRAVDADKIKWPFDLLGRETVGFTGQSETKAYMDTAHSVQRMGAVRTYAGPAVGTNAGEGSVDWTRIAPSVHVDRVALVGMMLRS